MIDWVTSLISSLGYIGIALLMFVETLFPPIPSEIVMPFAGFTASQGSLNIWGVIAAGIIGSFGGAVTLYAIAKLLREDHIEALIEKHGRKIGLSKKDFHRSQAWFDRNSYVAVFLCRILPGVRSLVSIPAGMRKMRLSAFLFLSFLGTSIWTLVLGFGGYLLGEQYHRLSERVDIVGTTILAIIACTVCYFLMRRLFGDQSDRDE